MSLFFKFCKKSKLNQEVLCLVNLQDSIIMPPNSFFDNVKNKELCEQYYQEYKRILSNKKTILSTHLKSTETDDIRVYIDILTSLEIHIHDILSNSNSKGYNYEYVTNLLARLNGYAHILKAIEEESFLRMAALSSLKSIPFLSNNKKNAIDNEISRLQIQIFNAQKDIELINLQTNSCFSIIENLNLEKDPKYYNDLRGRIIGYIPEFIPDSLKEYVENYQNKNYLTLMQIKLEVLLFKNKNILKDLENEFDNLLEFTHIDRTARIHSINRLITKYMAIKEYKRIEDKKLLYKLVEFKVNSYEIDYGNHREILHDCAMSKEEKEIMKEVFFKKVSTFMQSNCVFEEYKRFDFSKRDYRILANLINDAVKNKYGVFDYGRILCSPELTMLLFSINSPYKMQSFFKNFQVSDCTYLAVTSLRRNMFEFEEYIPLETIMRLTGVFLKNPHHKEKILEDKELYDLYKIYDCLLYSVIKPKSPSHVFENVSKITITDQKILFYPELIKIYNKEMAQGRKLVFPKSLKKLTIRVDNYDREFLKYYEFELNEGLEDLFILETPTYATPPKVLELPSTLEHCEITIRPETIRFRDYTNSKLLVSEIRFKNFLKNLMHAQRLLTPNELPLIKTIEFKGKSSITTFSLNIRKLVFGRKFERETIYNDFQNKVKEMYEKLYKVVQAFEFEIPKEEANFDNLKKLENELYNYVQSHYEELTSFNDGMYIWFLEFIKNNDYSKRDELLKILKNKILKYTYLSEALPIDMGEKHKFADYVKSFLKIKFKLLISTLSESNEPLIDDDTPKDEAELFKDLLIDYLKNFAIYIYKDKELSKKIEDIIEKYHGDYSYFEYLLRNPFLLNLKLSIEDPNYHDTILDVFKKHKVKIPKEIMDKVKTKNQEDCISYLQLMEIIIKNGNISTPSKNNFTFNAYLDDLSLIYKSAKSKLYNHNFNYEPEECKTLELDANKNQKLIRKKQN